MQKKSKRVMITAAIAALCAVSVIALTGCTLSPDLVAEKLSAESPNFTVTTTMPSENGEVIAIYRVNGKQFCSKTTVGDTVSYNALMQNNEKYYKIYGTDENYLKKEISAEDFENDTTLKNILKIKSSVAGYQTYFEETEEGKYQLKQDQTLAFSNLVYGTDAAELSPEDAEILKNVTLLYADNAFTLTFPKDEQNITFVFSDIGNTRLEAFTETMPKEEK